MTRLGPIVRNNGGDLVRVLEALNGFKTKHGSWPTELLISRVTLANLKEHHLTDLGFALLENRVRLLAVGDYKLVSRDDSGRTFDYDSEGWSGGRLEEPAEVWLGFGLGFETNRRAVEGLIPDETVEAVDACVPASVSHIGFVATNTAGELLVTEPKGHPHGVSATFSKAKVEAGERPSQTLVRCLRQRVSRGALSVFPVPAVWISTNSTGFYFAGLLRDGDLPPPEGIVKLRWLPRESAEKALRNSKNPTSRTRDLGLLGSVDGTCLSPQRRVLLMVRELHLMGFERLRAPAYEYPVSWRCPVVPVSWTYREHGGRFAEHHPSLSRLLGETALNHTYSSASGQHPFGWTDATFASPRELAEKFVRERRELALAGWGPDPEYAEWFRRALEMTGPNGLISAFSDYDEPGGHLRALGAPVRTVPLPPPGVVTEDEFARFDRRFQE